MNNKYLYFANATDDALLIPASGVSAIDVTGAAQVQFYFKDITDACCKSYYEELNQ